MYSRPGRITIGPQLTPMVKTLILTCAGVFAWMVLAGSLSGPRSPNSITTIFGLVPADVWGRLYLWQLVTYIFLHAGLGHIFWNMFSLWMFGCQLERVWGSREFLRFFLITGIGAGLFSAVMDPASPIPIVGASGACYGVLMAFGMLFPNRYVYLWFLLPVKVKYFVAVLGGITFLNALNSPGSTIAHVAHLGGMLVAFLYLKGLLSPAKIRQSYYRWKIRRMRSRFEVYENRRPEPRRDREDDFWIN